MLFDDQLAALEADSKRIGTQGGELDFALLLDGLAAEREQGITIDVAYRYFSTERRKFIVADTPGPRAVHAQHGHRRLDRRLRRDPGRRAQGRPHPDAPAHASSSRALGIRHAASRSTRWTSSTTTRRPFREIEARCREIAAELGLDDGLHPGLGAARRQRRRRAATRCRGTTGRR